MAATSDEELRGPDDCVLQGAVKLVTKIDLLKSKPLIVWSDACRKVFDGVNTPLTPTLVLMPPQLARPFQTQMDARNVEAGAVFLPEDDSCVECPVFFSFWRDYLVGS